MSNRICNFGTCTLVFLMLTIAASRPATALPGDWINFVDETSTRIVGDPMDPSVGIGDVEEKDMAIGDLDKDGDLDLVIVRKEPAYGAGLRNVLYMNEGGIMVERTSALAPALKDIGGDRDVVIVDVDGDMWLDVVTAATLVNPNRVYMNRGEIAGVWQGLDFDPNRISLAGTFCGVAAGFVNGDDAVDLFFSGYLGEDDRLMINDGNGFFTEDPQAFNVAGFGVGAQIIDLNGDGANDIIKINSFGPPGSEHNPLVIVYYNDPLNLGQFAAPVDLIDRAGANPYMAIAGELNNEGNPEVYIVRDTQDTYLINTGNDPVTGFAIFTELTVQNSTNTASFGGNIRLVDWDNDGFFEPVVATFDAEDSQACPENNPVRRLAALRNLGNTPNVTLEDPLDPATRFWNTFDTHDIVVFDIDGDELLDMWSGTCTGNNVFMGVATGACCLPDGSCAILTQIECDAQCGTYQGDNIPCLVQCVVQATEACCFPDNTCQDLTLCQCAQQGGASKGVGTTCANPNICVPTGACCLPNFGGCIVVSEEDCLNLCGNYKGDGTNCNFPLCPRRFVKKEIESGPESPPQSAPPAPSFDLGACCFDDGTCIEISECNCDNQGGTYSGDGTTCAGVVCFGGQCCILGPPFTCTDDVKKDVCLADCGVWTQFATCAGLPCPSFVGGACCLEDVCVDGASQSWCECQGGVYRGDFTECSCITTCGPPNGACCLQSGTCVENTADECDSLCGSFNGEGSLCSGIIFCPIIVPIFGACCLLDGTCADTSRCNCESQGGLWQGDFTDCAETTCPAVCGGIQGIPCLNVNEFCKFGEGECCCDFKGFCTPIPQVCTAQFDPVCGCDGITYGNACQADAAQVTVLHAGECTGSCCLPEGVCVDGLTENECTCQCGVYGGNNNLCAAPTCVPPVEACCFLDAPCADLVPCECLQQGGTLPGGGFGICANLPPNTCPVCANASTKGCWKELTDAEVTSVNMILLKTGKVMVQHRSGPAAGINQKYQIFDPATEQFSPSPPAEATIPYNMYCAAFDQLGADGRVLFAGGRSGEDTRISAIYDPDLDEQGLNAWSAQDDMAALRFYPTTITLSH
ncbi:MAG: hypothetical protein IH897_06145, partial [Planctomycetes bacterium]|nr:hypothetical protein [Planctomycetota bacterium]